MTGAEVALFGRDGIGSDANGLDYSGDSLAFAADGAKLADAGNENGAVRVVLDGAALQAYREAFPCHLDADGFQLG